MAGDGAVVVSYSVTFEARSLACFLKKSLSSGRVRGIIILGRNSKDSTLRKSELRKIRSVSMLNLASTA